MKTLSYFLVWSLCMFISVTALSEMESAFFELEEFLGFLYRLSKLGKEITKKFAFLLGVNIDLKLRAFGLKTFVFRFTVCNTFRFALILFLRTFRLLIFVWSEKILLTICVKVGCRFFCMSAWDHIRSWLHGTFHNLHITIVFIFLFQLADCFLLGTWFLEEQLVPAKYILVKVFKNEEWILLEKIKTVFSDEVYIKIFTEDDKWVTIFYRMVIIVCFLNVKMT